MPTALLSLLLIGGTDIESTPDNVNIEDKHHIAEFQSTEFLFRRQSDVFISHNSCTKQEFRSDIEAIVATVPFSTLTPRELESFYISTDNRRIWGHVVDEDKYYYKNAFGKDKHYEQLNTRDFKSFGGAFSLIIYPDMLTTETNQSSKPHLAEEMTLHLVTKSGDTLATPVTLPSGDNYWNQVYDFSTEFRDNRIRTKLSSTFDKDVTVEIHYAFGSEKRHQFYTLPKDKINSWLEIPLQELDGYSDGNLTYLGVYYEEKSEVDEVSIIERLTRRSFESKVELFDSTNPHLYNQVSVRGGCISKQN